MQNLPRGNSKTKITLRGLAQEGVVSGNHGRCQHLTGPSSPPIPADQGHPRIQGHAHVCQIRRLLPRESLYNHPNKLQCGDQVLF